jgi:hypothetical protein
MDYTHIIEMEVQDSRVWIIIRINYLSNAEVLVSSSCSIARCLSCAGVRGMWNFLR